MKRAIFYNMFRNGDLFVTREFARSIIHQVPSFEWYYAHGNHPDSLKDLPATFLPMAHHWEVCMSNKCVKHDVSELLPVYKKLHEYEQVRYYSLQSPIYINTWPGCFYNIHFNASTYPNMREYYNIWHDLAKITSEYIQKEIILENNFIDYFPIINEDVYDKKIVNEFHENLWQAGYKKRILFANGKSMSGQSQLGSVNDAIVKLAHQFPKVAMIVTSKITHDKLPKNIFYTSDFFLKDFDLIEIAMFSSYCDIIVGKNSGPFTYSHTKKNVSDANKTFVSFSNLDRDNLLYDLTANCQFIHSDKAEESEFEQIMYDIITQKY
jgi:hypothetical protein